MTRSPFLLSIADYMRVRGYSKRTIHTYIRWIKSFIIFSQKRHPSDMGRDEVVAYLTYLAVKRKVSSSTQSLALNALVFLYDKFLEKPLGDVSECHRARRQQKLPSVLTPSEVQSLLSLLSGKHRLMACIMYGSGLRRIELIRLRVNAIDFDFGHIRIWNGKGYKHRIVTLASELTSALKYQIEKVKILLEEDQQSAGYTHHTSRCEHRCINNVKPISDSFSQ
ncbi:MAG: tyrosine-type recombinase/integrase [Gammaproteobacteria bacterium]|nr:tyrosine-type recombinase/integrase [Gammaproteobacteria bacterium]